MNRIDGLSDDLLLKILSFLPTKVAISTSILSKRWECVWMWLPKLEYVSRHTERDGFKCLSEYENSLRCFLNRSMPLHRASVIERFRLELAFAGCKVEDIKLWIVIAVSRFVRELDIYYHDHSDMNNILPSSLYASKSLVTLKLKGNILLDVPRMVGLPSLKTLQLQHVRYLDRESFRKLLSICPVLEHLLVELYGNYVNMGKVTVKIPSLLSLSLEIPLAVLLDGLVIDTPSLKYFKLEDYNKDNHSSCLIEDMPQLEEAYIDVKYLDIERLIGSITSVKRLMLSSEVVYGGRFVFNQLEHLELCIGTNCASSLLVRLLEGSPNLRELDFFEMDHKDGYMAWWNKPETVPKCIMSSLQTFSWSGYYGIPQDKDIMVYILTNACQLKTVTISSENICTPKYEMMKELSLSYRASTACRLVFD